MKKTSAVALFLFLSCFAFPVYSACTGGWYSGYSCSDSVEAYDFAVSNVGGGYALSCGSGNSFSFCNSYPGCSYVTPRDGFDCSNLQPPKTCSDGSRVPPLSSCPQPIVTCWDGSTAPDQASCPPQTQTCWDGSVIPVTQQCPSNPNSFNTLESCTVNGLYWILEWSRCASACPKGFYSTTSDHICFLNQLPIVNCASGSHLPDGTCAPPPLPSDVVCPVGDKYSYSPIFDEYHKKWVCSLDVPHDALLREFAPPYPAICNNPAVDRNACVFSPILPFLRLNPCRYKTSGSCVDLGDGWSYQTASGVSIPKVVLDYTPVSDPYNPSVPDKKPATTSSSTTSSSTTGGSTSGGSTSGGSTSGGATSGGATSGGATSGGSTSGGSSSGNSNSGSINTGSNSSGGGGTTGGNGTTGGASGGSGGGNSSAAGSTGSNTTGSNTSGGSTSGGSTSGGSTSGGSTSGGSTSGGSTTGGSTTGGSTTGGSTTGGSGTGNGNGDCIPDSPGCLTAIDNSSIDFAVNAFKNAFGKFESDRLSTGTDLLKKGRGLDVVMDLPVLRRIAGAASLIFPSSLSSSACSSVKVPVSAGVISFDLVLPTCNLSPIKVILEWIIYALTLLYLYNLALSISLVRT